ncbi:MAG: GGDEF domain-containing protein [Gammaproteobacteria bacterium]|nr:MAG: GGDEF domain-containing protein [Gammaproteobacteria bacterium]
MLPKSNKLKDSKFLNLYETGFEAIFILEDGICLEQNQTAERIFGYSLSEAIGKPGIDWISPRDQALVFEKSISGYENPYEVIARHKNGREFPIEIRGRMVKFEDRLLRVTSILDISDKRLVESEIIRKDSVIDSIFSALPDLFFLLDLSGTILEYRANKNDQLYVDPVVFLDKKMQDVLPADVGDLFGIHIDKVINTGGIETFHYQLDLSGTTRYFEARISLIHDREQLVVIARDISESKYAQNQIIKTELKFRALFDSNVVCLIVVNQNNLINEWNSGASKLFGYSIAEAKGLPLANLIPERLRGFHKKGFEQAVINGTLSKEDVTHEVYGLHKDGREFPISLTLGCWHQNNNMYFSAMILDTTERKKAEAEILHKAHYDSLTELPNRFLAMDRLNQLLYDAKRGDEKIAVLFLDLDDFKRINDSLGHETGDKLLIEAAKRLSKSIRSADTVARLGGDEFIIILPKLKDASDARTSAENILSQFKMPFKINEREHVITSSIGIAIYPQDGESSSDLLRQADSAMYYAKNEGKNTYSFFTKSMNEESARWLAVEEQLNGAIRRQEFKVFYQLQRDAKDGNIIGAEALLRWNNLALGEVSPVEFIPIAESNGLINEIGYFVLDAAMAELKKWKNINSELKVSVNISPIQFRDLKLTKNIAVLLKQYQLNACDLELEITEGALMGERHYIVNTLNELAKLGVVIAMDDFGTGYSSLSYLRKYPFNVLKVDRSFVNNLDQESADKELVNATIVMAHALGLKVVAEGVENEQQMKILQEMNCDYLQGFLFSKPVNAQAFSKLLSKKNINRLKRKP